MPKKKPTVIVEGPQVKAGVTVSPAEKRHVVNRDRDCARFAVLVESDRPVSVEVQAAVYQGERRILRLLTPTAVPLHDRFDFDVVHVLPELGGEAVARATVRILNPKGCEAVTAEAAVELPAPPKED